MDIKNRLAHILYNMGVGGVVVMMKTNNKWFGLVYGV
jgi:hypothetical protein